MKQVRWGIIGASKFALEHMGPAIHLAKGADLYAVASRDLNKVAAFKNFCATCLAIPSYEELLQNPNIDAVYIPLPHHLHTEWAIKALNSGKHVLAEKPIAMHNNDFELLLKARDTTGLMASEAYMIVHHPQWQRARQMIGDGAIGNVIHITGGFSYDNSDDPTNIRNQAKMGGGGMRDIGVYIIGAATYVMNQALENITAKVRLENGFDVFTSIQGTLGASQYSTYVSTRMHPHQEMSFHGSTGILRLTAPFNPNVFGEARLELHQPALGLRVERFPGANHYIKQVEAFNYSILTSKPLVWTLEQARSTQQAIDTVLSVATAIT
jgi:predicted dehydrogenase